MLKAYPGATRALLGRWFQCRFKLRQTGAVDVNLLYPDRLSMVWFYSQEPNNMHSLPGDEALAQLSIALHHMRTALDILDHAEAPGEVGAILDSAIVRLEELLGRSGPTNVQAMIAEIEQELAGLPSSLWDIPSG